MRILFQIGWRNLWRNKRRSFVVIASISMGVVAMLLSMGVMNGMNNQMVDNTISTSLGHLSIQHEKYTDDPKLAYGFEFTDKLQEKIFGLPHVSGFAPRLKLEGMIRSSEASRGVMIMGVVPEREKTVSKIADYMLPGEKSGFIDHPDSRHIVISRTMAEKLDILVGDKVVLMFQDTTGEISGFAMMVKGLFRSPVESFDKFVVYVPLARFQTMTGIGDKISEIVFKVDNRKQVDAVVSTLKAKKIASHLSVLSWKEKAPDLFNSVTIFDSMMYMSFSIIFITVVFSVANTLIMAIMERFHEIGVMKSIGTRPSWIAGMVIFESINLGLVGLITGVGISGLILLYFANYGIDFSQFMASVRSIGIGHIIYPLIRTKDIIASVLIVFITTLIAAVYPATKAARIKPLDALHHI